MNVITIGSKILDDAIVAVGIAKNIKNIKRVTNISPFVFSYNTKKGKKPSEVLELEDKYLLENLDIEITGKGPFAELADEYDAILIDILDARMYIRELEFSDSSIIRLTESDYNKTNYEAIKAYLETKDKKIVSTRMINPRQLTDEELAAELERYAKWIKKQFPNKTVILECNHNAYEYIDYTAHMVIDKNVTDIIAFNRFYDKCNAMLQKMLGCQAIPCPEKIYGDARRQQFTFFTLNTNYYSYMLTAVNDIMSGKYSSKACISMYEALAEKDLELFVANNMVDRLLAMETDKKLALIGGSEAAKSYIAARLKKFIDIHVQISDDFAQQLEQIDKDKYLCIVPFLYNDVDIPCELTNAGFIYNRDYIVSTCAPIVINGFVGDYEDSLDNRISSATPVDLCITGGGNVIQIGTPSGASSMSLELFGQNMVKVDDKVSSPVTDKLKIVMGLSSQVTIGESTTFIKNVCLNAGEFGAIEIGRDCMFSSDILVKCNPRLVAQTGSNSITVGDHAWIGNRASLFNGAVVNNGSVLGARGVLMSEIPNNCVAVGDPARVVKKNTAWHRNLTEMDINEISEEFRKLTMD